MRESPGPANSKKVCFSVAAAAGFGGFFSQRAIPRFRDHAGALGQAKHVQDERNFAVPHDARPGKGFNRLELFAKRLHHDLFRVVDLIDDQPEPPLIRSQHDDVDRAVRSRLVTLLCRQFSSRLRYTRGRRRPRSR